MVSGIENCCKIPRGSVVGGGDACEDITLALLKRGFTPGTAV